MTVNGSTAAPGGFNVAHSIDFGAAGATLWFSPGDDGAYIYFDDGEGCGGGGTTGPASPTSAAQVPTQARSTSAPSTRDPTFRDETFAPTTPTTSAPATADGSSFNDDSDSSTLLIVIIVVALVLVLLCVLLGLWKKANGAKDNELNQWDERQRASAVIIPNPAYHAGAAAASVHTVTSTAMYAVPMEQTQNSGDRTAPGTYCVLAEPGYQTRRALPAASVYDSLASNPSAEPQHTNQAAGTRGTDEDDYAAGGLLRQQSSA